MELKCKYCNKDIKVKDRWEYQWVEYKARQVEIVGTADGGLVNHDLDAGVFCNQTCLLDYLSFEAEAE
jgi:hypothetical protein